MKASPPQPILLLAISCVLRHVGALVKESMDWSRMRMMFDLFGSVSFCAPQRTPYDVAYQGKDGDICTVSEPYKLCSCKVFALA